MFSGFVVGEFTVLGVAVVARKIAAQENVVITGFFV